MFKNSKTFLIFSIISIIFAGLSVLSSCRKDPGMEVIITVRMFDDTNVVVPNARIEMFKDDVKVVGYSNAYGEFTHVFELPAQLDISAKKDTLNGIGILNIGSPGETIRKTIFVF